MTDSLLVILIYLLLLVAIAVTLYKIGRELTDAIDRLLHKLQTGTTEDRRR